MHVKSIGEFKRIFMLNLANIITLCDTNVNSSSHEYQKNDYFVSP